MILNHRYTIVLVLFLFARSVFALDPTSTEPISIESDTASLSETNETSIYKGNVLITQGASQLAADQIVVKAKDRKISVIEATGSPAQFRQFIGTKDETIGYAETITYSAKNGILTFSGSAKLNQQNNSFSGEKIEYEITKRAIKARGNPLAGERVKIEYHPAAAQTKEKAPLKKDAIEIENLETAPEDSQIDTSVARDSQSVAPETDNTQPEATHSDEDRTDKTQPRPDNQ